MSAREAAGPPPRIGMFGTFDVDNYGDLLYPLVARRELGERLGPIELRAFGPFGPSHPLVLDGAEPCEALGAPTPERRAELASRLDAVLVGGGDLGHLRDAEAYSHPYGVEPEDMAAVAPSRFFIGGLGPEMERRVPVAWNALGVPFDLASEEAAVVREALAERRYVAVRDERSAQRLRDAGVGVQIDVVPDTAVLLPRVFPPEELETSLDYLRVMGWYPEDERPLVVQASTHALPWASPLAATLARIADRRPIVLLETGPCHDDGDFAEALRLYLPRRVYRIPAAVELQDLTAAIAGSLAFVGTSYHGNLVAFAYGRPHVLLDVSRSSKSEELMRMLGTGDRLVRTPEDLSAPVDAALETGADADLLARLQARADEHLDRVADLVREASPVPRAPTAQERALAAGHRSRERRRSEARELVHARAWRLRESLLEARRKDAAAGGPAVASLFGRAGRKVRRVLGIGTPSFGSGPDERYRAWLERRARTVDHPRRLAKEAAALRHRPVISIIMPTFDTPPGWLLQAIHSVRRQVYRNWELSIADDGSTRTDTREVLERVARSDPRITVSFLERNSGIAAASNEALAHTRGEFVAILDHDDELTPDALLRVAQRIERERDLDYVYTGEDKKDAAGRRIEPHFKPDWSPELLLSANYLTHLSVIRRDLLERIGGFREGFQGSQDYDLLLRVTEATERIAHVPLPLYSWRQIPGSAAGSVAAKPYAYESAKRALADALRRRGEEGEVLDGHHWGYYRVRFRVDPRARVSIVVLTKGFDDMTRTCVGRIQQRSTWRPHEIFVATPGRDVTAPSYLEGRVVSAPSAAGPASLANAGAAEATGDYIVFVHDDVRIVEPAWIEAMLEHAQRRDIGVVGVRMCLPDGTPQHEGIVIGPDGVPRTLAQRGYFGIDRTVHNRSAVSGACTMVRADVFRELGGYEQAVDPLHDIDLCLRALEKGHRIVYTPYAVATHEACRLSDAGERTVRRFSDRWAGYRDSFYNENLRFDLLYRL